MWVRGGVVLACDGVDGLVVAGGVDDQLAQQFAGGRVDHADLEVLDEQQDEGSGVGSADADVVEAAVDPQVARIAHLTAGAIGENIWQWSGSHRLPSSTLAAEAVADWMGSAAHRANILRPSYTRFGVGSAVNGSEVRLAELFTE